MDEWKGIFIGGIFLGLVFGFALTSIIINFSLLKDTIQLSKQCQELNLEWDEEKQQCIDNAIKMTVTYETTSYVKQPEPIKQFNPADPLINYPTTDLNHPEQLSWSYDYSFWLNVSEMELPIHFEYNSNYFYGAQIVGDKINDYRFRILTFNCFYENQPNKIETISLWTALGREAKIYFKTSDKAQQYNYSAEELEGCRESHQKQIERRWTYE